MGAQQFAPFNAESVGVFNPSDSSFTVVDISAQLTGNYKFTGAAATADGRVVFAPHNADAVGVFVLAPLLVSMIRLLVFGPPVRLKRQEQRPELFSANF